MFDEPVHLSPYTPQWTEVYKAERRLLSALLSPHPAIEHIGSTAVPGLSAKPVVDIMLGVVQLPPPQSFCDDVANLGYEALGEAGVNGRWYFRKRHPFACNLHVVQVGGTHWTQNLALRNYLRGSSDAKRRYEAAKQAALEAGHTMLLAYSRAKAAVIEELLREAKR